MSEAERTYTPDEARIYLDGYNAALRAQENEPLTCEGCRHEESVSEYCEGCMRNGFFGDYYEPAPDTKG